MGECEMKETDWQGRLDEVVSESLWDDIIAGKYDTTLGLRPDGVWHDDEYWYVSFPADPSGRWVAWDTKVERYTGECK
jgi:hypothetical protein